MSPISPTVPYVELSKLPTTPVHIGCAIRSDFLSLRCLNEITESI